MDKYITKIHHQNCENIRCTVCYADGQIIGDVLEEATRNDSTDHLGLYHAFLKQNNIEPETEHGWWSNEAYERGNIANYVATFKMSLIDKEE